MENLPIEASVFDANEVSTRAQEAIERARHEKKQFNFGLPELDEFFVMNRPRKIIGVPADTSHGKTSFLTFTARNFANQIDADSGEIGIYATWEDTIEDFGLADIASMSRIPMASLYSGDVSEQEWGAMLNAAAQRAGTPLWLIGQSDQDNARRHRLTITDLWAALDYITTVQQRKVRFLMIDYLQRISRTDMQREQSGARLQFTEIMDQIKDMTLFYGCTTYVGSQVGRKIDERKWRQPQKHDAMETSNFEHTCDGMISLWMPAKSRDAWKIGDTIQEKTGINSKAIFVTERLMLMETLKQKKAKAPVLKAFDFMYEYNEFVPYGESHA